MSAPALARTDDQQPDNPLDDEIATLRQAMLMRHPDARDRVRRARDRRLRDAAIQRRIAELADRYRAVFGARREKLSATGSASGRPARLVDLDVLVETALARAAALEADVDAIDAMLDETVTGNSSGARSTTGAPTRGKKRGGRKATKQQDRRVRDLALRQVEAGGTPEAMRRPASRSSIVALGNRGKLDAAQVLAAVRIARVFECISRATMPRIGRMDAAGRGPRHSGFREAHMDPVLAAERSALYLPWIEAIAAPAADIDAALVIDVVVEGHALDTAARARHTGYRRALRMLKDALDAYGTARARWARGTDFAAVRGEG